MCHMQTLCLSLIRSSSLKMASHRPDNDTSVVQRLRNLLSNKAFIVVAGQTPLHLHDLYNRLRLWEKEYLRDTEGLRKAESPAPDLVASIPEQLEVVSDDITAIEERHESKQGTEYGSISRMYLF